MSFAALSQAPWLAYDERSTLAEHKRQQAAKDKEASKKDSKFENDDTSTLVQGEERRDVNGKVMTKKELVAEGIIRVIVNCVVM